MGVGPSREPAAVFRGRKVRAAAKKQAMTSAHVGELWAGISETHRLIALEVQALPSARGPSRQLSQRPSWAPVAPAPPPPVHASALSTRNRRLQPPAARPPQPRLNRRSILQQRAPRPPLPRACQCLRFRRTRPRTSPMTLDNLGVTHGYATVNGINMHYVEKGRGPLVVLLHGFPEMWWSWRYRDPRAGRGRVPRRRSRHARVQRHRGEGTLRRRHATGRRHRPARPSGRREGHHRRPRLGRGVAWHLASTRQARVQKLVVMNCPHPIVFQKALVSKRSQLRRSWYMFFFQLPVLPERMLTRGKGRGTTEMIALPRDRQG